MAESLVSGWTEDIDYIMKTDGSALDLSGMTVAIVARKTNGTEITLSGTLTVTDATNGIVRFAPAAGDILLATATEYRVRWKVTDATSKVSYFPNADAERWVIRI